MSESEGDKSVVATKWDEIKAIVTDLELDIHKNAKGNAAAGVRARKGLRSLRGTVTELVKLTVDRDKSKKVHKAAAKQKKAAS